MASIKADGGPLPQSPLPGDKGEKANGDGDLDYTITMNESEDEASSDEALTGKASQKANGTSSASPKVNGKVTSDEDSQNSLSKDVKAKKGDTADGENNAAKDQGSTDQTPDADSKGVEESETDAQEKSESLAENKGGLEGKKPDSEQTEEQKVRESDGATDDHRKEIAASGEEKDGEPKDRKEVNKDQESPEELPEADGNKTQSSESVKVNLPEQDMIDDDVVEIEDSPAKPSIGSVFESKAGSKLARDAANAAVARVSNSAVSGAGFVPYLSSVPGTSFLNSSSGMQLVHVQGAGLVYVSGSSGAQSSATSATAFNPTMAGMAGIGKGQPQNSASLFMPQYTNMMTNQNRFMMPPYNQGARATVPSAPLLTNIPEKPTSSIGMIENIRWEVENHINIKPKYAKPNPKAELGNLAKWIFDLGSDLVKEFVYHDLVRIQQSRNAEGTLSNKEKDDFVKLQEIDKELNHKIGHLKRRLNKSCRCGFRTELSNVLYNHQQHAHIERGGFFSCILCKFSTRQPSTFKFHMESIHARPGFVENRPSFFECPLCPYETNYTNRLDQHKVRCQRQFREAFNLHPSCITGPEVNLCLENVFYFVFTRQFMNSIMPKPPTPVVSSSTKIRDMPNNEAASVNMQTRRGMPSSLPGTVIPSSKQIATKPPAQTFQAGAAAVKPQPQHNSAVSRSFPVMSSKMNTVQSQPATSTYTSGRPQVPSQSQTQPSTNQAPNQPNNGFEVCEICGGYVKDRKALRIHFYYAHRIDMPFGVFERPLAPLYCATCFARFWTAQGLQKHIEVHKNDMMGTTQTSNGVAGKCISCGHRVPNILMHMRMVHNRELRHYLAALMCIFCGRRFATKKEVEAHMGKMHGVVVKNSSVQGSFDKQPPPPPAPSVSKPSHQQPKASTPPQKIPTDPAPKSSTKGKNRGSQCVLCNLSFNRNVDLTRHCMRVHHTCMKCGLVVVDKESLARHTCLHSASGMRTCQICKESGFHPAYYIKHMRDKHLRKCSVVLRHIDRAVVETMKRPITISDSEEDEPAGKPPGPKCRKRSAATKEEVKDDHDETQTEGRDQSVKNDSDCKKETDFNDKEECGKEDTKKSEEESDGDGKGKSEHPVVGDNSVDKQDMDSESVAGKVEDDVNSDGKKASGDSEICEKPGDSERERVDDTQDKSSDDVNDHGKADCDGSAQVHNPGTDDQESTSDKLCEESSDRRSSKRKIEETEDDGETSGPGRKSQRRMSQIKENQD